MGDVVTSQLNVTRHIHISDNTRRDVLEVKGLVIDLGSCAWDVLRKTESVILKYHLSPQKLHGPIYNLWPPPQMLVLWICDRSLSPNPKKEKMRCVVRSLTHTYTPPPKKLYYMCDPMMLCGLVDSLPLPKKGFVLYELWPPKSHCNSLQRCCHVHHFTVAAG